MKTQVHTNDLFDMDEASKLSKLIAAAPELLEALKTIVDRGKFKGQGRMALDRIVAIAEQAIKKAEG